MLRTRTGMRNFFFTCWTGNKYAVVRGSNQQGPAVPLSNHLPRLCEKKERSRASRVEQQLDAKHSGEWRPTVVEPAHQNDFQEDAIPSNPASGPENHPRSSRIEHADGCSDVFRRRWLLLHGAGKPSSNESLRGAISSRFPSGPFPITEDPCFVSPSGLSALQSHRCVQRPGVQEEFD